MTKRSSKFPRAAAIVTAVALSVGAVAVGGAAAQASPSTSFAYATVSVEHVKVVRQSTNTAGMSQLRKALRLVKSALKTSERSTVLLQRGLAAGPETRKGARLVEQSRALGERAYDIFVSSQQEFYAAEQAHVEREEEILSSGRAPVSAERWLDLRGEYLLTAEDYRMSTA